MLIMMAGTIDNSLILSSNLNAVGVKVFSSMVERTYPKSASWEKESSWAGRTKGMTMNWRHVPLYG